MNFAIFNVADILSRRVSISFVWDSKKRAGKSMTVKPAKKVEPTKKTEDGEKDGEKRTAR